MSHINNDYVYSLTRGNDNFSKLIESIAITKDLGKTFYGILSVSKLNAKYTSNIIRFCKRIGCERVTVHYITIRGDSLNKIELSPEEWNSCKKMIIKTAIKNDILVRYEEAFISNSYIFSKDIKNQCAINFNENIMVMPSGDTFMCTMFLDYPHLSGYFWNGTTFELKASINEIDICSNENIVGCPGYYYTRNNIELKNYIPVCAFRKTQSENIPVEVTRAIYDKS